MHLLSYALNAKFDAYNNNTFFRYIFYIVYLFYLVLFFYVYFLHLLYMSSIFVHFCKCLDSSIQFDFRDLI